MDNFLGIIIVVLLLAASIGPFLRTLFSRRYPRESRSSNPSSQQNVQTAPATSPGLDRLRVELRDGSTLTGVGGPLDLEEAITAFRQAVEATPPEAADRHVYLNRLGVALYHRYRLIEDVTDLEAAINAFQQAVEATPPGGTDLPTYTKNLNRGLSARAALAGKQADMQPSSMNPQSVPPATSSPSYHQFMYLKLLGRELFERYERAGDLADLRAAISAVQRAIQVMPTDLPDNGLDLLSYLDTLGRELFNRYTDTRSVADLEAAVTAFQQVVQVTPPDAVDRPEYLSNLGLGLRVRYERTRNIADLKEAIRVSQQAVDAAPLDLLERSELLRNLGIARHDYYIHSRDQADLKAAISAFRQAVEDTPATSPARSIRLTSLGAGLLDLYKYTKNRADLEKAITAFQQAVEAASSDSPERPLLLASLGAGLRDRYECTTNQTDLEEAIRVSQQAVQAAPLDLPERSDLLRNLGLMLVEHFHTTVDPASLEATISLWEQSWSLQHLHFAALPVTYQLGQQHQGEGIASDLVTAYLEQAEANGRFILDREIEHHLRFLSVPPRALEIAEGSKSRLLTQLVGRGQLPLPPGLAPDIAVREQHLLAELIALDTEELATHDRPVLMQKETGSLQRLQQRQMLLHNLEQLWTQIARDSPEGAEYVALRRGDVPTWQEFTNLATALGPETALLSFFLIQEEALLFLLRAGWHAPRVIGIPMNEADRADLRETLHREVHIPRTGERWDQPLRPLLANAQLHLKGVKRLILAPAGIGHLLPWAVLAERVGLYTPTGLPLPLVTLPALSVLPRLQQRLRVSEGQALVIGNPLGDRPHMENEARAVAERFGTTPLLREAATKQVVLANLERASLIHLATHAFFDSENPLDSGIVLAGEEKLTAREILQYRLQTDLLVLSSCESGQVGFLGGEELAGLSQAFLQAGVRSLLVTLWEVDDEATAAFIQAFYIEWQEKRVDKAQALRQAMTQIQQDPQHPNWSHPYYWGAFVLVGDWN